jgi:hypothetical protein
MIWTYLATPAERPGSRGSHWEWKGGGALSLDLEQTVAARKAIDEREDTIQARRAKTKLSAIPDDPIAH